jgi:hypothetical protein
VGALTGARAAVTLRLRLLVRRAFLRLVDNEPQSTQAGEAIARELELNAAESERCEQGAQPEDLVLHFTAWERTNISARGLSRRDPDEWMEVVALYGHLKDVAARGSWPPTAATLRDLAARLRNARPHDLPPPNR